MSPLGGAGAEHPTSTDAANAATPTRLPLNAFSSTRVHRDPTSLTDPVGLATYSGPMLRSIKTLCRLACVGVVLTILSGGGTGSASAAPGVRITEGSDQSLQSMLAATDGAPNADSGAQAEYILSLIHI